MFVNVAPKKRGVAWAVGCNEVKPRGITEAAYGEESKNGICMSGVRI